MSFWSPKFMLACDCSIIRHTHCSPSPFIPRGEGETSCSFPTIQSTPTTTVWPPAHLICSAHLAEDYWNSAVLRVRDTGLFQWRTSSSHGTWQWKANQFWCYFTIEFNSSANNTPLNCPPHSTMVCHCSRLCCIVQVSHICLFYLNM